MAIPFFAFLWLVLVGGFIQRVAGPTYRGHALHYSALEIIVCSAVLAGLWATIIVDVVLRVRRGNRQLTRADLWACFCPPLRMVSRSQEMGGKIWFPLIGWQEVNRGLRTKLERFFNVPMIAVALLILPVLVVEHLWGDSLNQRDHAWALILLDSSTVIIWVAFTTEFIVMCAVSENKLTYCKVHWLDLAIILLPLISFARALRLARLSRLARLGKISRAYRLRGLAMRGFRAVLLADVIARMIGRTPEKELQRLQSLVTAKEMELQDLRQQVSELEAKVAANNASSRVVGSPPEIDGSLIT